MALLVRVRLFAILCSVFASFVSTDLNWTWMPKGSKGAPRFLARNRIPSSGADIARSNSEQDETGPRHATVEGSEGSRQQKNE